MAFCHDQQSDVAQSRRGPERGFGALDALVVPRNPEPREVVDVRVVRDVRDHALVDPHEKKIDRHLHKAVYSTHGVGWRWLPNRAKVK